MKTKKLNQFERGWIIGNFSPTLHSTSEFEVGIKQYKSGDTELSHFHKIATEYTTVVSGIFEFNGKQFASGDIIIIPPGEVASFHCIQSGQIVVVKLPSIPGDKYFQEEAKHET